MCVGVVCVVVNREMYTSDCDICCLINEEIRLVADEKKEG